MATADGGSDEDDDVDDVVGVGAGDGLNEDDGDEFALLSLVEC